MDLFGSGILGGFVCTAPNWPGFNSEDYNRAYLRAVGYSEDELNEIEERIGSQNEESVKETEPVEKFQYQYFMDSGDYEQFPDKADEQDEDESAQYVESFRDWVDRTNIRVAHEALKKEIKLNTYNFSDCEIVHPHFFSLGEKPYATIDRNGINFNKMCLRKMEKYEEDADQIDVYYNAVTGYSDCIWLDCRP